MIDDDISNNLPWSKEPFCFLTNEQKIQLKDKGEVISCSIGDVIWSSDDSQHQFFIIAGSLSLREKNSEKNIKDRKKFLVLDSKTEAGTNFFGALLGLVQVEASASTDEVKVIRWNTDLWEIHASPSLNLFWAKLRERYQPNALSVPYEGFYPFIPCVTRETGAACLAMVSEYLQSPIELRWAEYQLKGQETKHLIQAGEKLGVQLQSEDALQQYEFEQRWTELKRRLIFPILLNWNQQYWVVVFGFKGDRLIIADPLNAGCEAVSRSAVEEAWDGCFLRVDLAQTQEKFSLKWFIPAAKRQWKDLRNVLIASLTLQILGLATPILTRIIFDKAIGQQNGSLLNVMAVGLLGVAVLETIVSISRSLIFNFTARRLDLGFSAQVFSHLIRLPLSYFESNRKIGDTVIRVQELEKIRQFLTSTLTALLDGTFAIIYLGLMLFISVKLTLFSIVILLLFVAVIWLSTPLLRRVLDETYNKRSATQSFLVEAISGIQSVKAHTAERDVRDQWENFFAQYIEKSFDASVISEISNQAVSFLSSLSYLIVLWVGTAIIINQPNQLSIGSLIAFQILAAKATTPLLRLARLWQNFQQVLLSVEHLKDILDTVPEISPETGLVLPELKGKIKFDKVFFRHHPQQDFILDGVSFEIEPGQFVGVVGASGSGKSTLSKLLLGLYRPTSGSIVLDDEFDVEVADLNSLRQQVGVVLQEDFLFDAPVWKNIVLGNSDAAAEDAMEAARLSDADGFIRKLPKGYNTKIGERGTRLSGGQRQRLALARMFLSKAPILILDEATSALDAQTERTVLSNLRKVCAGRTVFMVTHRLKSIENADLILALGEGRIELGTHEALLAKGGIYSVLHRSQTSLD